ATSSERVAVASWRTNEQIVPCSAIDDVGSSLSIDGIIAVATGGGVIPSPCKDCIVSLAAENGIVSRTGIDQIVPCPCIDSIVAGLPFKTVVPSIAFQYI